MRALVLVVAAAFLVGVGVLARRSGSSLLAMTPVASAGRESGTLLEDLHGPLRVPIEPARAAPAESEIEAPVEAHLPLSVARPRGLAVLVLQQGSRRPLPGVGVEAWIYRGRGLTTLELAIGADGRAFLAPGDLHNVTGLAFVIDDPEMGADKVVRPDRSVDELRESSEPLEILVPRGEWRDFQVVGPQGAPLEGATLEASRLRPARTGADGRGRVRMSAPPLEHVNVWAPGHRVEFVAVPREEEAWIIRLDRANRLEFALVGSDDVRGYHVEVRLPETMKQRTFYQSKYVQTPGRPCDGTPGRWTRARARGRSRWSLGFNSAGLAVVDQIYDGGKLEVELLSFDETLEVRSIALSAEGRTERVEFAVAAPPPHLTGRVVDQADRPVAGALVRMAPLGGRATIDLSGFPGFPVWAPRVQTNVQGEFRIPAPSDGGTVVVFSRRGLAGRALTVSEIETLDGRVVLEVGRTVILDVRGRDGEALDGGYSTGMAYLHVRPSVHLGHDVWRDASAREHPAANGRDLGVPYFLFADLPTDLARFRFTYLPDDEFLLHDTRIPSARFVSRKAVAELGIGK